MAHVKDTTDVHLLREQTIWKDSKGRILLIYRRAFTWVNNRYEPSDVDILILDTLKLTRQPYGHIVKLITQGSMKYAGEFIDTREVLN
ncbi:MAG: hypothetical protein ABIN80_22930 [Dyadobacter sp.]|uniref:hypothetical protein n=1 Tax=Dyadobacter sp. TaxID=1914288 RepID=UPI0032659CFB